MKIKLLLRKVTSREIEPIRKVLASTFIALPAMFSIAVGMRNTEPPMSPDFPVDEPEVTQAIDAFVPLMHKTQWPVENQANLSSAKVREYADLWIDAAKQGEIKPLPQLGFRNSPLDNVTGQILRTEEEIEGKLERQMQQSLNAGRIDEAADDALRVVRLSFALRYSGLLVQSMMNARADHGLKVLEVTAPKLPEARRNEVANELKSLRTDGPRFAEMCKDSYTLYLKDLDAYQVTYRDRDRCPNLNPLRALPVGTDPIPTLQKAGDEICRVRYPGPQKPFETVLIHALDHEALTQASISDILKALS